MGLISLEDNHVGFFRRESETLASRLGSDDVEDFLKKRWTLAGLEERKDIL